MEGDAWDHQHINWKEGGGGRTMYETGVKSLLLGAGGET